LEAAPELLRMLVHDHQQAKSEAEGYSAPAAK
jgi:hypothetical protein